MWHLKESKGDSGTFHREEVVLVQKNHTPYYNIPLGNNTVA